MEYMFSSTGAFNQPLDYDGWNTARVTSMSSMFAGARSFNQNLTWNTSSLTTIYGMFGESGAFNSLLVWDTSNVEDMRF
jgi:hypothetical protein